MKPEQAGPYYELKFTASPGQLDLLLARARHYFSEPRSHARGLNRTTYYDTGGLDLLGSALAGDADKMKLRAREYVEDGGRSYALEWKIKSGQLVTKRRLRHDRPFPGRSLMDWGGREEIRRFFADYGPHPGNLRPRLTLANLRHRFIVPRDGMRLTVDTALRAEGFWTETGDFIAAPYDFPLVIVELKGDRLPAVPEELSGIELSRTAFSKYADLHELAVNEYGLPG